MIVIAILSLFATAGCAQRGDGVVLVDEWEYRAGFDESYFQEYNPADWKKTMIPVNFSALPEFEDYTGWITLRLEIPPHLNEYLIGGQPLAINAGRLLDVSYVYVNGHLFGQLGSAKPYREAAMRPFLRDVPFNSIRRDPSAPNVLYIALYNTGKYPLEVMDEMNLGLSDRVFRRHLYDEVTSFGLLMLYLASGLYHLLLFVRRPRDRYNFFFAMFAILLSVYWFVANTTTRDYFFENHVELHRKLEHMIMFTLPPFFVNFLTQFFHGRSSRFGQVYGLLSLWAIVLTGFGDLALMRYCRDAFYLVLLFAFAYILFYVIREMIRKNRDAWYLILGILLLMASIVHDTLASEDVIHSGRIANYTFLVFVGGLAGIMANRFMEITDRVEELNVHLEQEVEERTRELKQSLGEVQRLKEHQDGDYFLTSLLLNPLAGDFSRGETVAVDLLTRQNKKFRFRKWDSEIGGDISVADTIRLRDREYTVFINADAMGKSMQGAGGALVLGTVFRSVLTRTYERPAMSGKSPEVWLRDCAFELQNVFASFNGSMLISVVLGLVDNVNGVTFFLNAEHPWLVLYRGGRAEFLDEELFLRKVGVPGLQESFRLHTFQMRPGDVIISGSDGRDDILLGTLEATGQRQINEDETEFLRRVEEGRGDLQAIERGLLGVGRLTDDLSLLRIGYRPGEAAPESPAEFQTELESARRAHRAGDLAAAEAHYQRAAEIQRSSGAGPEAAAELFRDRIRLSIKKRDSQELGGLCREALSLESADADLLYLAAYGLKLAGRIPEALDAASRLGLRDPHHSKNLINLVDLRRLSGDLPAAQDALRLLKRVDPQHATIGRLEELLSKRADSP
ncbi:MAG: SpoIIE family protein phosphatase [bacterium]|nr:SpoIIE family protein phosphatase [bacterium]